MQNNEKTCVAFAFSPPRYGGLEVILPLLWELKSHKLCSVIWFFFSNTEKSKVQLEQDPFLFSITREVCSKILCGERLLGVALSCLFACFYSVIGKKVLIFFPEGMAGRLGVLLAKIPRVSVVTYPKVMTIFEPKKAGVPSDSAMISLSLDGKENAVGYPKFYQSWQDLLQEKSDIGSQETKNIVVFIPSFVEGLFAEKEMERWFLEVMAAIQKEKTGWNIVVKPHPMIAKEKIEALCLEAKISDKVITYKNAGALLAGADIAVSHHSSVILDSLASGVPTVYYHFFTPQWLARYPEKSCFLGIGEHYVENVDALESTLAALKPSDKKVVEGFFAKINHCEGLLALLRQKQIIS